MTASSFTMKLTSPSSVIMLQAANDGYHVVRVLIDGTDIFALLVYWTWRCDLHDRLAVQIEKWDGVHISLTKIKI